MLSSFHLAAARSAMRGPKIEREVHQDDSKGDNPASNQKEWKPLPEEQAIQCRPVSDFPSVP